MDSLDGKIIEVTNWEKYNPRKDLKSTHWVRLQNSLFEDPNFFDFNHSELLFWIYLLSMASKKQSGAIRLSIAHADRIGRFSESDIISSIAKLIELDCIRISGEGRYTDVTYTTHDQYETNTVENPTNERTNVTNVTNERKEVCTEAEEKPASGAIDDFSGDSEIEAFLKPISKPTQERWIKLYSDSQWIRSEFLKAINWIEANPQKAPKKNLARFMGNWLSRGWDQYRKTLPSNAANTGGHIDWSKFT